MCRNRQYKYVYHYIGGYEELYDMRFPEVENLIANGIPAALQDVYRKLKEQALAYEAQWGIEGGVKDGRFTAVPAETVHPSVRSKFHFWSNAQMQQFYEPEKYDRGSELEKEMRHALHDSEWSGIDLAKVFNDPEWREQFAECYEAYTNGEPFNGFPFANQEDRTGPCL